MDLRARELLDWITAQGYAGVTLESGGGDASARRYFRFTTAEGSLIAMDAPDQVADCRAFIHVQGLMAMAGVNVPEIIAADPVAGFMLLQDLGRSDYLAAFAAGDREPLVSAAIDALVRWQAATRPGVLADFDAALLQRELALFSDWYVERHLRVTPDRQWWETWAAACEALVDNALAQPQVWVHRDFMARNLLLAHPMPGVIDFQDARTGPVTYDLVSLLRDAFFSFPPDEEARFVETYLERGRQAGISLPDDAMRAIDLMGAQRHLKVLGIFARLSYRDNKPHYLKDAPRFLRYLDRELAPYPDFAPLRDLVLALPASSQP